MKGKVLDQSATGNDRLILHLERDFKVHTTKKGVLKRNCTGYNRVRRSVQIQGVEAGCGQGVNPTSGGGWELKFNFFA